MKHYSGTPALGSDTRKIKINELQEGYKKTKTLLMKNIHVLAYSLE